MELVDGALDGGLLGAVDEGVAAALDQHRGDADVVVQQQLAQGHLVGLGRQVADVQFAHLIHLPLPPKTIFHRKTCHR